VSGGRQEPWAPEVKARALELAAESGPLAASRTLEREGLNVSINTIRSWMRREGRKANAQVELVVGAMPAELLDRQMEWHERRAAMVAELGVTAASALQACKAAIRSGRSVDSRNYATTVGILTDKLNVLTNQPTSRTESLHLHADVEQTRSLQAEIAALEKELEHE
jgi:hypothetical protein